MGPQPTSGQLRRRPDRVGKAQHAGPAFGFDLLRAEPKGRDAAIDGDAFAARRPEQRRGHAEYLRPPFADRHCKAPGPAAFDFRERSRLLEPREHRGPIVGPQAWTGAECAALWSAALGRRVRYVGDNIETWARRVTARLPDTSVEALRDHYRELQRGGGRVDAEDLRRCAEALGRAPIPYARYVASAAGRWLSRPTPYLASDSSGAWR